MSNIVTNEKSNHDVDDTLIRNEKKTQNLHAKMWDLYLEKMVEWIDQIPEAPILELKLHDLGLKEIPLFLANGKHDHLEYLDVSGNEIQRIPIEFVSKFNRTLKHLNISNNRFKKDYLKETTILSYYFDNLQCLDFSYNSSIFLDDLLEKLTCKKGIRTLKLSHSPPRKNNLYNCLKKIYDMKQLTELDLSGWNLNNIPIELCESCSHLKILDFSHNQCQELPTEMTKLVGLEELSIQYCGLIHIHGRGWSDMKNLKKIFLCGNNLSFIPISLLELESLSYIYLSYNEFNCIPREIIDEMKSRKDKSKSIIETDGTSLGETLSLSDYIPIIIDEDLEETNFGNYHHGFANPRIHMKLNTKNTFPHGDDLIDRKEGLLRIIMSGNYESCQLRKDLQSEIGDLLACKNYRELSFLPVFIEDSSWCIEKIVVQKQCKLINEKESLLMRNSKVFIGCEECGKNKHFLKEMKIDEIICLGNQVTQHYPGIFNYTVFNDSFLSQNGSRNVNEKTRDRIFVIFHKCYELIINARKKGKSILILCSSGNNSSVVIVISYLMSYYAKNFNTCYSFMEKQRPSLCISDDFREYLLEYEGKYNLSKKEWIQDPSQCLIS